MTLHFITNCDGFVGSVGGFVTASVGGRATVNTTRNLTISLLGMFVLAGSNNLLNKTLLYDYA